MPPGAVAVRCFWLALCSSSVSPILAPLLSFQTLPENQPHHRPSQYLSASHRSFRSPDHLLAWPHQARSFHFGSDYASPPWYLTPSSSPSLSFTSLFDLLGRFEPRQEPPMIDGPCMTTM
jgi:hypothetical protein